MKNKKTIIALTILLAVLALGIGYATITNITLNITGSASASASADNFKVKFDSSVTPTGTNATGRITGDRAAEITVSGLTTKNQTATATYTIVNESEDLAATLSANVTGNTNPTFFDVAYSFGTTTLAPGGTTTVTVTVTLLKTPATDQTGTVAITLIAEPKQ